MKGLLFGSIAAAALGIAALVAATTPADAHHAVQGQFEVVKTLTTQGKLTRIDMVNPHPQLYFDFPGASGKSVNWRIEAPAIAALRRMGVLRILKVGESYKVEYSSARNGEPIALLRAIETKDGKRFGSLLADPSRPPE